MAERPSATSFNFSAGEDGEQLAGEAGRLLDNGWMLDEDKAGLRKTFIFPTYAKALDFILMTGIESKLQNHHAELRNSYKTVDFHWTTHRPRGLSSKDTHMARYCDEQASRLGVLAGET